MELVLPFLSLDKMEAFLRSLLNSGLNGSPLGLRSRERGWQISTEIPALILTGCVTSAEPLSIL